MGETCSRSKNCSGADSRHTCARLPLLKNRRPFRQKTPTKNMASASGDNNQNALSRIPQLLNLSDLGAILNRFYPEEARAQRQEASVVLDLHIDTDGHIKSVDVVQSAGAEFDAAALRVAKLLRFTSAFMGSQRVAVKLRQAIQFKLSNS